MSIISRLMSVFARARLTAFRQRAPGQPGADVVLGHNQALRDVGVIGTYGLASHPRPGATAVVISVGGDLANSSIVAIDHPNLRPALDIGEVSVYHESGSMVRLRSDGTIVMTSTTGVIIDSPHLVVNGSVSDASGTMQAMRDLYNAHAHPGGGPPNPQQ